MEFIEAVCEFHAPGLSRILVNFVAKLSIKEPFEMTTHPRREVFADVIKRTYESTNKRFGTDIQPPD